MWPRYRILCTLLYILYFNNNKGRLCRDYELAIKTRHRYFLFLFEQVFLLNVITRAEDARWLRG